MPDSILIVSFSPIQGFIAEARRVADLSAGSVILSRLAQAIQKSLAQDGDVVYPQGMDTNDAPNVLVAVVPAERVKEIADNAQKALEIEWNSIAQAAREQNENRLRPDAAWNSIWDRQIKSHWEFFWGAAELGNDYQAAYQVARKALDASKRARFFEAAEESGLKDSLSGARSALRTERLNAKEYWEQMSEKFLNAGDVRLRKNERLDALGFVKRFYDWGQKVSFNSTSDVAASGYIRRADKTLLHNHARSVCDLLGKPPPSTKEGWPASLDADLLYMETFTVQRLNSDYGIETPDSLKLKASLASLKSLYAKDGSPPSYYAIVSMDGDNMGKAVDACQTKDAHKQFSNNLSQFAVQVRSGMQGQAGQIVYAGGDDVLALLPLDDVFTLLPEWAGKFGQVKDAAGNPCSASAGIVIVHHRYPLGTALRAARQAESEAKLVNHTSASPGTVCIHWLRRSGEELRVRSSWDGLAGRVGQMRADFNSGLSTRFPYELASEAEPAARLDENARRALLNRLLRRHVEKNTEFDVTRHTDEWLVWSKTLDHILPNEKEYGAESASFPVGLRELANWLILALFLNQQIEKGGDQ
jgi:CRISPR-associated protein Cmr2